ncbi:hypothetical protein [Brevibacillus laterosporus]|uniref:hypothetical protein n=1 Tax=Brevibacillus laterosporus TaxID=1465 RepID=UPI001F1F5EC0|nr:hypothetical protein [Brevibacillus laterosporus]
MVGYCKHVYALYYQLLAEAEDDPFVFFSISWATASDIIGGFGSSGCQKAYPLREKAWYTKKNRAY